MTDEPIIVRKHGRIVSISIPLLYDEPDPVRQAEIDERRAIANRDLPASLRRLDALDDPVSRAVLDLHRRRADYDRWNCEVCLLGNDMGDREAWPCDTVLAVAGVHGIPLDDFWLLDRPDDGSLDQPDPAPENP